MGSSRERRPNSRPAVRPNLSSNDVLAPLIPIRNFDGNGNGVRSLRAALASRTPPVFLIECMLELICNLYEPGNNDRKQQLYAMLRNLFTERSLLPPVSVIPGFDELRTRFRTHLTNIFVQARKELFPATPEDQLLVIQRPLQNTSSALSFSRYESDFEELEFIAGGGFGLVYKARNKLDNVVYAVKKILFRSSKPRIAEKILREVQLISRLHHPNIVAYKNAWMDACPPHMIHDYLSHMEETSYTASSEILTTESRELIEAVTRRVETSSSNSGSIVFESSSTVHSSVQTRSFTGTLTQQSLVPVNNLRLSQYRRVPESVLYIQMQLCHSTLRHWLQKRPIADLTETKYVLNIFRQILEGVSYIHNNGIVHRDLKPENIFFNETGERVLIGDFGLAKLLESEAADTAVASRGFMDLSRGPTTSVGTRSYAAPEQLRGSECNAKSDMYSIGVILLELLHPFDTVMERHKTIENLRQKQQIPEAVKTKWPCLGDLIGALTAPNPNDRPSAEEVLKRLKPKPKEFDSQKESIGQLKEMITQRDAEISRLRKLLEEKESVIAQLTQK